MKIGNKVIRFTAFDIICIFVSILGFVGLGWFEESLFRILSVGTSVCMLLALFDSLHHRLRYNIETNNESNKFHTPKTDNIITTKVVNNTAKHMYVEQNSTQIDGKTADQQVYKTPYTSQNTKMNTYNIDDLDVYKTGYKTFKVVPLVQPQDTNETTQKTDTTTENTNNDGNNSSQAEENTTEIPIESIVESTVNNIVENTIEKSWFEDYDEEEENEEDEEETPINDVDNPPVSAPPAEQVVPPNHKKLDIDLPFSQIIDLENPPNTPTEELDYVISHLLEIIYNVLSINTVAFIWIDYDNQRFILGPHLSDSKTRAHITKSNDIPFGDDLLSEIAQNAKPQIWSIIPPESELKYVPYYTNPVGTNSFIGLPVIHNNTISAILCADTDKKEAYDEGVYVFLGYFTKLLSTLINSLDNHLAKENADKVLSLTNNFNNIVTQYGGSFSDICKAIIDLIVEITSCSQLGVVTYSQNRQIWNICSYKAIADINNDFLYAPISLQNTLIGACISNAKPLVVQEQLSRYTRVNEYEPDLKQGAFLAVPIKSVTDCYGALFIEFEDTKRANNVDMDILQAVCNHTGIMLEKITLTQLFNEHVEREVKTNILTKKAFQQRVNEECSKAIDSAITNKVEHTNLIIAFVALDKYDSLAESSKQILILNSIVDLIRPKLKSFEIIGRIKNDIIGILMFNREEYQVKLMLENIKQKVATQYIEMDNTRYSATISAGISALHINDTAESFTRNATSALRHAQNKNQGNYIQIFQ